MRMIVLFDLPVTSKDERRAATKFRNYLLSEGYVMLQFSIYYRICNGYDMVTKYERRLDSHLPGSGSIRLLTVTEKQFENMRILVGDESPIEKKIKGNQMSVF